MLINLSTLDLVDSDDVHVLQAWSPLYQAWVCIVSERSAEPPANTIELTIEDLTRIADLQAQGKTKDEALRAVGVLGAHPG